MKDQFSLTIRTVTVNTVTRHELYSNLDNYIIMSSNAKILIVHVVYIRLIETRHTFLKN